MIGHTRIIERLGRLVASKKLPSALLFSGTSGIGKSLVARELAKKILCGNPNPTTGEVCGGCTACKITQSGAHPDLHIAECAVDEGNVESIRSLLSRLSLRAFAGGARIAILNDADNLNLSAANALLKSLEEPRPDVYFILVAETASRLPSTVLSRCQQWHFDQLTDDDLTEILAQLGQTIPLATIKLAEGSVKSALTLANTDLPTETIVTLMTKISLGDSTAIMELVRTVASEKEKIPAKLAIVRTQARALMQDNLSDRSKARIWSRFLANIIESERMILDRNFNAPATLFTLFASLHPANTTSFTNFGHGGTLGQDIF